MQSRYALLWLLAAQLVAILPRLDVLPIWLLGLWSAMAYWHWQILRGRARFPNSWLKIALAALTVAAIYWQFKKLMNLEAMLAILICAVSLKLLELKSSRDHWLVLLLCYFIVASGFLFSQQIGMMLVALGQLVVVLMAQQAMHRQQHQPRSMLKLTAAMALQSLPLMLVLFLVFPRIGPLWSMPLPGKDARTGMSDSLEFGDVARLSRSGELAFRVTFSGSVPAIEELYWRGLVLEEFNGRRWSRAPWRHTLRADSPVVRDGIEYIVTLEPGFHEWLYALPVAAVARSDIRHNSAYLWLPRRPLSGRLSYSARTDFQAVKPEPFPETLRRNRYLPAAGNPRARVVAGQWRELDSNRDKLNAAMAFLRAQNLSYTLTPPTLGENNVDEFLFDARAGFCEHFAGSFAFLMRAAGVPARLVVGYQGGEYNADGGYLLVHQSDAHAWVEVWLEEGGWQRVDPTAVVAPSRVSGGADAFMRQQGSFLADSPLSLRRFQWANQFRYFIDEINYAWARWVLNYDEQRQWQLLRNLLGEVSPLRLVLVVLIAGGLPLAWLAMSAWRLPRRLGRDVASRVYLRCCRFLARRGLERGEGETPHQFLSRVNREAPRWSVWFGRVTEAYVAHSYCAESDAAREDAIQRLRKLRRPFKN